MAKVANISREDSVQQNLDTWCFEVGSIYEQYSQAAAKKFIRYIGKKPVVDLGCGDGAATSVFIKNGNPTTAVDINTEKLARIKGAEIIEADFVTYLQNPVDNLFIHHSLEHYVDYRAVLDLISENLKKGCYCYIAVPKGDEPHSVHHVAFQDAYELVPPNLKVIEVWESDDALWPEYGVIAKK